jgi:hypothetical protein
MTDDELLEKVTERQGAVDIRDMLQAQIDAISADLKVECLTRDQRRIPTGTWEILLVSQDRKTLNAKKLVSAGVTVAQIEAGTESTHVESLRVQKRKAEG